MLLIRCDSVIIKKDPQRITELNLKYNWEVMMHEEGIMHYASTGIILQ